MKEAWRENLQKLKGVKVLFDEPMVLHTSIGVGGRADALVYPENAGTLQEVVAMLTGREVPFVPVGNCTNLIVRDGGFRGAIVALKHLRTLSLLARNGKEAVIYAEAGLSLSELLTFAVQASLTGMEFCAGIPGTVGGAVRMNAGAYGSEMKDILSRVSMINGHGRVRFFERAALCFSYRNLEIPTGSLITGADFRLVEGDRKSIEDRVSEILKTRWSKHPLQYRNAGSIFKNPPGMPAGRIIDEAGLKGLRVGDAEVSTQHGNFIVNRGRATAKDILSLVEVVRQRVFEARGVSLEMEVKVIGDDE